ncbi:MAG: PH domain-containing protein [Clostridia bacterium]|nr:PH domain-containing protein [Clostridia bacterium]
MIDFDGSGFFARLRKVDNGAFGKMIDDFMIDDERIVGSYQSLRDGVVFTNKRVITINIQGVTGKKKDFTSIPYNKITTFSLETAGFFDADAELEIYISAVGKVKFEFTGSTNVKEICKIISSYALNT